MTKGKDRGTSEHFWSFLGTSIFPGPFHEVPDEKDAKMLLMFLF